ncbi:fibronectin type III domain-containing protein [Simiduia aestuariiviva]|uniref:Fibronectin type-III domain-containing protein n=1 Tax=Simiduia aestuariiviva TaxID=1510459 RepID=A0A839UPL6_9GAMM|nr:fibronectin type III domain-containing protein [Simiduia aestuariiviva]MBB3168671.1 hypothetical protein [Simiduia aestuariiviva]
MQIGGRQNARIGDLLVERGVISHKQLKQAIKLQRARREQDIQFNIAPDPKRHALGAILVELGYISRWQLRRNLNWQMVMRKAAMVMVLASPIMNTACGGGGGSGESGKSAIVQPVTSPTASPTPTPTPTPTNSPTPTPTPEPTPEPTPVPEGPVSVSGPVTVNWNTPTLRENGDPLDLSELGGYEVRYREEGAPDFTYVVVEGGWETSKYIGDLYGSYEFEVAAYDNNGLYSQFVPGRVNEG